MEHEEDGVIEELIDATKEVAELAIVGKGRDVGEGVLDAFDDGGCDFEVAVGILAGEVEVGRCHGSMIGDGGEKGNSRMGSWRDVLEG